MRRAWLLPFVVVAAGCGGSAEAPAPTPASDPNALSADGISVRLPDGWTGRILIGASGRPVLHAASFAVEANDTDEGQIAQEAMGINGIYLNVRDLGAGTADRSLPLRFAPPDFAPSSFEGGHRREAAAEVSSRWGALRRDGDLRRRRRSPAAVPRPAERSALIAPADRVLAGADPRCEWKTPSPDTACM